MRFHEIRIRLQTLSSSYKLPASQSAQVGGGCYWNQLNTAIQQSTFVWIDESIAGIRSVIAFSLSPDVQMPAAEKVYKGTAQPIKQWQLTNKRKSMRRSRPKLGWNGDPGILTRFKRSGSLNTGSQATQLRRQPIKFYRQLLLQRLRLVRVACLRSIRSW